MENRYNLSNVEAKFKEYLLAVNGSNTTYSDVLKSKTIKNYLSDLRHFSGWLTINRPDKDITTTIDESDVTQYKSYLEQSSIPVATINRRLSTLRKYFSFCISQSWMTSNPAKKVSNYTIPSEKIISKPSDDTSIALEAYTRFLNESYDDVNLVAQHRKVLEELLVINSN